MTWASGTTYRTRWAGSVAFLGRGMAPLARRLAPERPDPVFPAWQGMQYMIEMSSVQDGGDAAAYSAVLDLIERGMAPER